MDRLVFRLLIPLLVASIVTQISAPAFGTGSNYNPGVVAGQWAKYGHISANWYSSDNNLYLVPPPIGELQSVNSTTITVQNVHGPYITASRIRFYSNGTRLSDSLQRDVQTSEGNLTDWILAGNLTAGNETYPTSRQTFNSTIPRIYLGVTRNVNVLNINQSYPFLYGTTAKLKINAFWDQISGVLLEFHFVFVVSGTTRVAYGNADVAIVDSNIFGVFSHGSDFSITADPSHTGFTAGASASSAIKLTSLKGFSGNVTLLIDEVFCSAIGCPRADLNTYNVNLMANGTAMSTLTFTATISTAYDIVVNATSGGLTHSVTVEFTVSKPPPPPDFSLTATASLSIQAGKSDTATINITPGNGFTSQVNLTVTAPDGISVQLARNSITGSGTIDLTVTIANNLAPGTYTVTIKAAGGSQTHTKTITVTVTTPPSASSAASNLILGLDPALFYIIGGAIAAFLIAGGGLAIRMKRLANARAQASTGDFMVSSIGW